MSEQSPNRFNGRLLKIKHCGKRSLDHAFPEATGWIVRCICSYLSVETIRMLGPRLSEQLGTPLPYLLHRAQARYEEDLRGIRDFPGTLALQLGLPNDALAIPGRPTSAPIGPNPSRRLFGN